ncbi:hypothetical protein PR001_g11625 [Phytophthora rubi]|uniref:Uncharacterized protein n=2 Tax=Phytophthora rubi TaxID=129364 RepID=A0A6A3MHL9_9STRA|nr:hypothetical protein PR001_g11625 [Phytophthora rubi]
MTPQSSSLPEIGDDDCDTPEDFKYHRMRCHRAEKPYPVRRLQLRGVRMLDVYPARGERVAPGHEVEGTAETPLRAFLFLFRGRLLPKEDVEQHDEEEEKMAAPAAAGNDNEEEEDTPPTQVAK